MNLTKPINRPELDPEKKVSKRYQVFVNLMDELSEMDIPDDLVSKFNTLIEKLNTISSQDKSLTRKVYSAQSQILKDIEKAFKLVPKNYYKTLWLSLGMAAFGIPLGVAFGTALGNMGFIGIGIPIGLAMGTAYGASLDKKAEKEGRQLKTELMS